MTVNDMTSSCDVAISTVDLGKNFGSVQAVRGFSMSLLLGTSVALVGANGAGKTTLLKTIAGLSRPTSGAIKVLGLRPNLENLTHVRSISYLDQRRPLYRFLSVEDTLRFGSELNVNWDNARAIAGIESFDLPLKTKVGSLSGGQTAQLALVLALGKDAPILLLDEPMASLDPLARSIAIELISSHREKRKLIIVSSHIVSELEDMCDTLVVLSHGRVALEGPFDSLLSSWKEGALFLKDATKPLHAPKTGSFTLENLVNETLMSERKIGVTTQLEDRNPS